MKPERVTDKPKPQFTALHCRKIKLYKPTKVYPIRILTMDEMFDMLEKINKNND